MKSRSCPIAIGLVAGLFCSTVALADSQYETDRAYCNSSANQEGRALCLKEAVAAQGDRRRESSGSRSNKRQANEQEASSDSAGKDLKERAHEDAQKTRGFTHRQLQKARNFGARHAPAGSVNEPDKAPAALGK